MLAGDDAGYFCVEFGDVDDGASVFGLNVGGDGEVVVVVCYFTVIHETRVILDVFSIGVGGEDCVAVVFNEFVFRSGTGKFAFSVNEKNFVVSF